MKKGFAISVFCIVFQIATLFSQNPCLSILPVNCGVNTSVNIGAGAGDPLYPNGMGVGCYYSAGSGGKEKIYLLVASTTGTYSVQHVSSILYHIEYYFKDASMGCGPNDWTCLGVESNAGAAGAFNANAGDSIYILLNKDETIGTSFSFRVDCAVDNPCNHIINLTCGQTINYSDVTGYGNPDYPNGMGDSCFTVAGQGGWEKIYQLNAEYSGPVLLNTGWGYPFCEFYIMDASLGCSDTGWTCLSGPNFNGEDFLFNMNANDSIYILLNDNSPVASSSAFSIHCINTPECLNVEKLQCSTPDTFMIDAGVGDNNYNSMCCTGSPSPDGKEKIYKIVAPSSGLYEVTMTSNSASDIEIKYKDASTGCNTYDWDCLKEFDGNGYVYSFSFLAGDSIYFLINATDTLGFSGTVTLNCLPYICDNIEDIDCGEIKEAILAPGYGEQYLNLLTGTTCTNSGLNGKEQMYRFVPAYSGTYYFNSLNATSGYIRYYWRVQDSICNGNQVWNDIGYLATPGTIGYEYFTANDTVLILVQSVYNIGGSQQFSIDCPYPIECAVIDSIVCDSAITFIIDHGLGDPAFLNYILDCPVVSFGGTGGKEWFYKFNVPVTGNYHFYALNTDTNSFVSYMWKPATLFNNCTNANWICIGTTNVPGYLGQATMTGGTTAYILLNSQDTNFTSQTFRIECAEPSPCSNIVDITCDSNYIFSVANFGHYQFENSDFICSSNSSNNGGLESIYKFVAPATGTYFMNVNNTNGGSVSYSTSFSSFPPNCPSGMGTWNCIGITNVPDTMVSVNLDLASHVYFLLNSIDTTPTIHEFYIDCSQSNIQCPQISSVQCDSIYSIIVDEGFGNKNFNSSGIYAPLNDGRERILAYTPITSPTYIQLEVMSSSDFNFKYSYVLGSVDTCGTNTWTYLGYPLMGQTYAPIFVDTNQTLYVLINAIQTIGGISDITLHCVQNLHCFNIDTAVCGIDINCSFSSGNGGYFVPNGMDNLCTPQGSTGGKEQVYLFIAPINGLYSFDVIASTPDSFDYYYQPVVNDCNDDNWTCLGVLNVTGHLNVISLNQFDSIFILVNSRSVTSSTQIFKISCIDISNIESNSVESLTIYPNPAGDEIYISTHLPMEDFQAALYDLNGRLIKISYNKDVINISEFDAGLYMLRITMFNRTRYFKMIKQ